MTEMSYSHRSSGHKPPSTQNVAARVKSSISNVLSSEITDSYMWLTATTLNSDNLDPSLLENQKTTYLY